MKRGLWTLIACLALPISGSAAQPSGPEARTRELVEALTAMATPAEGATLDASARQANAATFARLDGLFDWDHLTRAPVAPHRKKLSAAQAERIGAAFRETVRWVAYLDSGAFFRTARWRVARVVGTDVTLHVHVVKEDVETLITFHWKLVASVLRIVDVSFDGASLVGDYQNQFGRILAKHGPEGLVQRLEKRRDEERASRKDLLP